MKPIDKTAKPKILRKVVKTKHRRRVKNPGKLEMAADKINNVLYHISVFGGFVMVIVMVYIIVVKGL